MLESVAEASRRSYGWTGSALLLVGLASGCRAEASDRTAEANSNAPISVSVAPVERRERPVALELDGTLLADEDSQVTSVVPGRVLEVLVERGSVVEAGAPLIRLRDVDYRLQARAARAQLEQARSRLGMEDTNTVPRPETLPEVASAASDAELAESNLRRAEELAQRGVLADQALEEARARAATARDRHRSALNAARVSLAALDSATVTLSQASTSASEAVVRAPFAGEIADRSVSVGEYVTPQTPIVTLVRTDPLRIELSVPQRHLQAVQPGQTVRLQVDAVPDRTFEATVRYVSASVRRDTRGLTVEAIVANTDHLLRPGLFATARLETGSTAEVSVVPASAIHTAAGVSRAFVVHDGRIEERVVSIAERDGDFVIIEEGLNAGEQIATESLDQLADGIAVTPRRAEP